MDKAKATSRPEGPPLNTPAAKRCTHNNVAAPCQATEYQPCYENRETNKGKLKACTDYVHDLQKRLLDKGRQLTASQKECQEAEQTLSQVRAKLTQHRAQVTGCQKRIQDLADRTVSIRANTQSMIMKLAEDFDKQLAEVHAEISTIISQFPSPPGTPEPPSVVWEGECTLPQPKQMEPGPIKLELEESAPRNEVAPEEHTPEEHPPVEDHANEHENQLGIDYNEESSTTGINKEPVMPTDKTC